VDIAQEKWEGSIALTKCFYCHEDADILIDQHVRGGLYEAAHGKVVSLNPCSKCEEYMRQGIIVITIKDGENDDADRVAYERAKTDWENSHPSRHYTRAEYGPFIPNPYRTGVFTVITEEGFRRMAEGLGLDAASTDNVISRRWMFMADSVAELGGLYAYLEATGQEIPYRKALRDAGKDPHQAAVERLRASRAEG
jgi:hypothetical protein